MKPPLLSEKPLVLHHKKKSLTVTSPEEDPVAALRKSFKNTSRSKSCETLDNETEEASYESNGSKTPDEEAQVPAKRSSTSPMEDRSPRKSPRFSNADKHREWPVSTPNLDRNVANLFELLTNQNSTELFNTLRTPGRMFPYRQRPEESLLKTPVQKPINNSNLIRSTNIDCFLSSPNNTNRLPIRLGPKSHLIMTTSTPAPSSGCLLTPVVDKNNSMSPITRSTQRMPKSMQVIVWSVQLVVDPS